MFFIEGCTIIGYSTGKGIKIKKSLELEKIESIPKDNWLTVSLKNNEIIKGKFISCVNDTLLVTFQASANLNAPISNSQFLSIEHDKALYKIPLDQVKEIHICKGDMSVVGAILGLVIDSFTMAIINFGRSWNR